MEEASALTSAEAALERGDYGQSLAYLQPLAKKHPSAAKNLNPLAKKHPRPVVQAASSRAPPNFFDDIDDNAFQ